MPEPAASGWRAARSGAPGSPAGALRAPQAGQRPPASARRRCGRHRSPVTRVSRTAHRNSARSTRWTAARRRFRAAPRCRSPRARPTISAAAPRAAGSMHGDHELRAAPRGHTGPARRWGLSRSEHRAVAPARRDHGRTPARLARRPARILDRRPHAVGSAPCGHCMDRCRMLGRSAGAKRNEPISGQRCYHRTQSMPAAPVPGLCPGPIIPKFSSLRLRRRGRQRNTNE